MAGLEVQTGKVPGTEVRRTPAPRPPFIGFLILVLAGIIWMMTILVGYAVFAKGANDAAAHDPAIPNVELNLGFQTIEFFLNEQTIISFWLAIIFFALFEMLFLYQRFFTDHVTIAKRRFRKWEDEGAQLHD